MKTLKLSLVALVWFLFQNLSAAQENTPAPATTNSPPAQQTNSPPTVATNVVVAAQPAPAPSATNGVTAAPTTAPVADAPGAKSSDRSIRFQFDGIPYADVLSRFAQMANKPLITDTTVEGTLTFNDARPYNYADATETLNLILSMKGVMVVETERFLRLVPLKQLPQMPIRIFRGLDNTGDAKPGEVVTVVLSLQNLESTDIAQSVSSMLSNAGSIAPMSRGRGLIITDRLSNIKRIRELLSEIDTASPAQRQMRTYSLLHSSGAVISDLINKTFGSATAPKRVEFNPNSKRYESLPPDPSDYVTAVFDEASRTLVLYGPGERITLAEALIKRFEDQSGSRIGEVRIFYPRSISAQDLARMVREAIPGVAEERESSSSSATKARLIVDLPTNRLIVTAPMAGQLDSIEKLVTKVDSSSADGSGSTTRFDDVQVTKIFRCRWADPETLARILTDSLSRPAFRPRTIPQFRVTVDPKTKDLILMGIPGDVQQAIDIAMQLDSSQPAQRGLRIFPLKSGRATDFALRLQQLYREQLKSQPVAAASEAVILGDDFNSRLIATATESQLALIEALVQQLDLDPSARGRKLKTFVLKHTSATQVASMITQLYSRFTEDPARRVSVTVSPDDQNLIVNAPESALTSIEEIVSTVDLEPPRGTFELRTYQLTEANAAEIAPTLARVFAERQDPRRRPSDVRPQPRFEADATSNTLMVVATKEQLEQIDQFIKDLPAPVQSVQLTKVYKCRWADPDTLSRIITDGLFRPLGRLRTMPPFRITIDPKTRNLILMGTPADVQQALEIAAQLDTEPPVQRLLRVISLKSSRASEFAQRIRPVYQEQVKTLPGGSVADAVILGDDTNSRLILAGIEPHLKLIEDLVKQLDSDAERPPRQLKAVILKHTSANSTANMISQLFSRQSDDPARRVIVTASADDQTIVVDAPESVFSRIEDLIQTLDLEPARGTIELRTYHLVEANAAELAPTLSRLFAERQDPRRRPTDVKPQPRFEVDVTGNVLMVAALREQMDEIDKLIQGLRTAVQYVQVTKIYKCQWADPDTLIRILSDALAKPSSRPRSVPAFKVTLDPKTRDLILLGTPTEVQQAIEIATQLDSNQPVPRLLRTFALKSSRASEFAQRIRPLYQEQVKTLPGAATADAVILGDDTNSRLIVTAAEPHLKLIEGLVKQLDTDADRPARQLKAVILKHTSANSTANMISQLFSRQSDDPARRVIVTASADDQTIVVDAPESVFSRIEDLIQTLDLEPARGTIELRTYHLVEANAAELAPTLSRLFAERQDPRRRPTDMKPQPRFEVDVTGNVLMVAALREQMDEIDKLIEGLRTAVQYVQVTKIFKCQWADPDTLVRVLTDALAKPSSRPRNVPAFKATLDPKTRDLILLGTPTEVQQAIEIATQLDSNQPAPRILRTFTLKSNRASEFALRIRQLYQEQVKSQPGAGAADAVILGDDTNSRLIATATEPQLKVIEELVKQLDTDAERPARQLKAIVLKNASAASVTAMVTQLFSRQSDDPARRVVITASTDDQSIVIEAPESTLARIEEVVATLDLEPARGTLELRTYHLVEASATELAPTLARLFAERQDPRLDPRQDQRRREAERRPQPRFEADATANVLIVAATREQLLQIDQLIKDVHTRAEVASEMRTFRLQYSDAAQMVQLLETILREDIGAGPGRGGPRTTLPRSPLSEYSRLRVAAAPAVNAVVVQGSPQRLALAEQLIISLDRADTGVSTVIQTVSLKKSQAEAVAEAVNKALAARGPKVGPKRLTVTPVLNSNSLLIDGPAAEVQEVMQIIRGLDEESTGSRIEVRIYKLENGNAKEISRILSQILQGMTRRQSRTGRTTQEVIVAEDDRTNSLIVTGLPDDLKLVEQLLPTLDQRPDHPDRDVSFVYLENADAFDVALRIEALYSGRAKNEQVVVDPDTTSNSVTIIAKRADMPEIENLIKRLDESAFDNSIQVRMEPLSRIPAEQMARMIQSLYPQMYQRELKVVDKIPPLPAEQTRPKPLGSAPAPTNAAPGKAISPDATAGGQKSDEAPPVIMAVDRTANVLIFSGPARELKQIHSIILDLSLSFVSNEAEFRQFPLKEADPVAAARTLNELFRQDPIQAGQAGQQRGQSQRGGQPSPAPQPAPQPQPGQPGQVIIPPPRIAVVAEPRTRSLIVRAKPADFSLLESLIKQLDVAGVSSQIEFRLIALKNAQADKVLPLVNQLVTQLNLSRPTDPLTVIKDPRGNALFAVARAVLLDQIESMIHDLDTPGNFAEAEVLLVSLKNARAAQLATILQEMLRPGARGEVTTEGRELQEQVRRLKVQNEHGETVILDLTKPIKIMADPLGGFGGSNRLIIASTPDNLKALGAVAAMMDTVPLMEGITARLVHLKHADAAAAAQTLNAIFQQGQRVLGGPGGPGGRGQQGPQGRGPGGAFGRGLSSQLNVAVDQPSNTLILSGQEESLNLALSIIDQLDREVESIVTEVKLFQLKYASALRLAPLLQSVFAERGTTAGTAGLRAQVSRLQTALGRTPPRTTDRPQSRPAVVIQADDTSNVLIVAARSDLMPLIEDVIRTLDIPEASGLSTIRIYPLQHADASTIQRLINELYRGPNSTQVRREDRPNVTIDERTNALIVSGNENAFAIITSLLDRLDRQLPLGFRDVQIIPLENSDAVSVAATLQRLLDARLKQKSGLGKQEAEALQMLVIGDPRSNALLVTGSRDGFELVRSLVAELDKAGPGISGQVRLIPLKHATAQAMGAALSTLFNQRYQAVRSPDVQRNRPIIIPDARSNSLLVAANVEDSRALDLLIEKLDRPPETPALTITVIGLQHNDSARVSAMIANVFASRRQSIMAAGQPPAPQDHVLVEADPLTNALIISSNAENLELIRGLLAKIDVEPTAIEGLIQTFTLKQADAQRAATMLRSLIDQGIYRPGLRGADPRGRSGRDAIAVTVDLRSNTLIVSASPENLLVVKELIKQIDSQANADAGNIQLFTLKHAKASQLATVLEQFFRARRAGETTGGATERSVPVTVTADDRTNTLLITGGRDIFPAIERMIEQLDSKEILAKTSFQVFPLKQATAGKLQATLTQLFARRPSAIQGQAPEPITVVADSWANALIIGAAPEDLPMVQSLIAQLDSDKGEPGLEVQVFQLAKADARRVAQTVQALYRSGGPGTGSPVTVNVDERLNALVVSAGQSDVKRIAELVKKLDTDQVANVSEIRIFPLTNARAIQLATILTSILNTKPASLTEQSPSRQSLLQFITRTTEGRDLVASALKEGVLITPDPRTNSLIVSAPLDYMTLLEQLIARLDSSLPQVAEIRVFNLKNADARQMSTILMTLFRLQRTPSQAATDRSVQYTLIKPAAEKEGIPEPGVEESTSATFGVAEENTLTLTVDLRTNSLIVGGTEHYVALASEIIQTLDSSPAQERQAEVYRLKNSRAPDVEGALRNFLRQDAQLVTAAVGTQAGQAMAQELLERQVSIVAETNSNALLISASPRYFGQVKLLIEQLDQPQLQVLIQVLLAEVTLDATSELGVDWSYHSGGSTSIGTASDLGAAEALKNFGGFSSGVSGSNFNFLLRALESEGRLEVLSRPQILTADNQEANVNIGQQVPFITNARVTERGDSINSVEYRNVGVELRVTPRISPDGFVKMDVGPRISQLTSSDVPLGGGARAPIINERSATTTVSVQSGQSILIGGLISTSDDTRTSAVPWLGKIPYLGALFRSHKKIEDRKELLIILTPQVLVKVEDATKTKDAKSMTREHLDRSTINEEFNRDPLQRQMLDPLYPEKKTNAPALKPGRSSPRRP